MAKATQYLMSTQDPASGGIHNKMRHETAMTSLAVLAMAACGHQPADPTPEGDSMRKALAFVLRPEAQEKDGYFGQNDGSRMYGHGITTLMLSEMLGMGADAAQDEVIRNKCRLAIDLDPAVAEGFQERQQSRRLALFAGLGRLGYVGDGVADDGLARGEECRARCADGRRSTMRSDTFAASTSRTRKAEVGVKMGGFGYQTKGREISTTAEGLLAMQVCGQYDAEEVKGASDRLLKDGVRQGERWFFYTTYYYAQGMYQRGGRHADEARQLVADLLLPLQSREGWWEGINGEERQGGKVYATAMAVLSLSVKNHFLPIYQR